jgi:hypothetical protein
MLDFVPDICDGLLPALLVIFDHQVQQGAHANFDRRRS